MTANHEHTPTVIEIRQAYFEYRSVFGFYDPAIYDEFNKWLEAHNARIEAAAEQRGKEQGWDEAMTTQIQRLISGDPDAERFQMPANPYRTDQEGDDA